MVLNPNVNNGKNLPFPQLVSENHQPSTVIYDEGVEDLKAQFPLHWGFFEAWNVVDGCFPHFSWRKKLGKHHYDTAIFTPTSPKSFRKYSNFKNRRKEETKTKLIPDFKLFIKMHHKKWPGFPRTKNTIRFTFFDASKQLHPIFLKTSHLRSPWSPFATILLRGYRRAGEVEASMDLLRWGFPKLGRFPLGLSNTIWWHDGNS